MLFVDRLVDAMADEETMLRTVAADLYGNGHGAAAEEISPAELAYKVFLTGLVASALASSPSSSDQSRPFARYWRQWRQGRAELPLRTAARGEESGRRAGSIVQSGWRDSLTTRSAGEFGLAAAEQPVALWPRGTSAGEERQSACAARRSPPDRRPGHRAIETGRSIRRADPTRHQPARKCRLSASAAAAAAMYRANGLL